MTDKSKSASPGDVGSGRAGFAAALRHGLWLVAERLMRWCVNPRLRARLLSVLGASIGANVRIYEVRLFNLELGFRNLVVGDDVHIGPGCQLDLKGRLTIGSRSTLSPGVTVLTHADPGSSHNSRLAPIYPARVAGVTVGEDCWIGACATVLCGTHLGDLSVIGAASLVTRDIPGHCVATGVPASVQKHLDAGPRQKS